MAPRAAERDAPGYSLETGMELLNVRAQSRESVRLLLWEAKRGGDRDQVGGVVRLDLNNRTPRVGTGDVGVDVAEAMVPQTTECS